MHAGGKNEDHIISTPFQNVKSMHHLIVEVAIYSILMKNGNN